MKIEFVTDNELALNHFKPVPLKKIIPDWYKDMPMNSFHPMDAVAYDKNKSTVAGTIRQCVPVRDYLTSGYVIINHSDIIVTPSEDKGYESFFIASKNVPLNKLVQSHPHSQCPVNIHGKNHHYIKIMNPWNIKTPKGYSCLFYQPEYLMEDKFKLFPGIVDTDSYHTSPVNFPGIVTSSESFLIKAGDPIMVVFPFKRDEWESTTSFCKIKPDYRFLSYFHNVYERFFHKKKKYK